MNITSRYFAEIQRLLNKVLETQNQAIEQAITATANALQQGGTVYAFGTGHSHMLAEELFTEPAVWLRCAPF